MSDLNLPYKEREINGTVYRATTLALDNWASLTETISNLLGEPIASIFRGDATLRADFRRSDIEVLISGLIGKISRLKILEIVAHMGKGLQAVSPEQRLLTDKAQKIWWPQHMKDLAPVVGLFLEAQYADFFEGVFDSMPETETEEIDLSEKESG